MGDNAEPAQHARNQPRYAPRYALSNALPNPHVARMSAPNSALAPRSVNKYALNNPQFALQSVPSSALRQPALDMEDVCTVDVKTGALAEVTVVIAAITVIAINPITDLVSLQMKQRSRMYQGNGRPIFSDHST